MRTSSDKRIILLVDDTPANIQVAHNILKDAYTIKIATSGAKALDLAKAVPQPDLIILDVMMPEMDGHEVCSRLKADPRTSDIPIIFVTGKTDAEDETRGFELGAVDYIHKPFSPLVVQARVRTQLTLREAREQLAEEKQKVDRLLEEADRLVGVIFDSASRMGNEADPVKLLRLNADMARDLVQADRCSIWSLDSVGRRVVDSSCARTSEYPNRCEQWLGWGMRRDKPSHCCERPVEGCALRS